MIDNRRGYLEQKRMEARLCGCTFFIVALGLVYIVYKFRAAIDAFGI